MASSNSIRSRRGILRAYCTVQRTGVPRKNKKQNLTPAKPLGTRLFLERKKQWKEDFQEFLGLIHQQYRGRRVSLILDGDSSHTAKASQRDANGFGIQLVWLPVRCPELNPMDHLWRHGKERICANRQYESIEEHVHRFLHYLEGLSVEETLRKAGVLSEDYWLKPE